MAPKPLARRTMAVAIVSGAVIASPAAHAAWPTTDVIAHFIAQQAQQAVTGAMDRVRDQVTNIGDLISAKVTDMGNLLDTKLQDGFTQNANYAKAQIGAVQQIADASNIANARVLRDVRNSELRDEHTVSPQACAALDAAQAAGRSAQQVSRIATAITDVMDPRGEAGPTTAAWFGQAQSVASANALHLARYCDADEAGANLCTLSSRPNADVRATSFLQEVYDGSDGVNAANDFVTNTVQPVVPAALRGDQLTSVAGQDASARRRAYDARMSLARNTMTYTIAMQAPAVQLNEQQQNQLRALGVDPPPTSGSWMQVLGLEVDRRFSDVGWAASLQNMTPTAVSREIAIQLSLANYIAMQNLRMQVRGNAMAAAQLAVGVERGFDSYVPMPAPTIASN